MERLSTIEIEQELSTLSGWKYMNNSIKKTFIFKDFIEAFGFISKVAMISEKLFHHPDWSGVYNKVVIQLSTHEAGGITQNDIKFAKMIEDYETGTASTQS